MEVDDEEMDGSTGTDQMAVSKSLISCFQAVMEQKSVAKIEHVFKMITNNLTYDDPGMFIKSLIRDERNRQIQDTTVMWLLNQVISLSNKFELYRSNETIELQKSILSASFMKQPALFCKIMEKYIAFTMVMVTASIKFTAPLRIDIFQMEEFKVAAIVENCTYKSIEIKDMGSLYNLLCTNIRLLSHGIQEVVCFENELIVKCSKCVLEAYRMGSLAIKSRCLQYFIVLFRNILNVDAELQPIIVALIEYIGEIEYRLPIWTDHKLVKAEEITKYVETAVEFLESPYIVKLFRPIYLRQASIAALNVLHTHQKIAVSAYDSVIQAIHWFLSTTIGLVNDAKLYAGVSEFVQTTIDKSVGFGQAVELLEFVVGDQLKDLHLDAWKMVDQHIGRMLNNDTCAKTHLNCFRAIFATARKIEHNYSMYLQQQKAKASTSLPIDLNDDIRKLNDKIISTNCSRHLFGNMDAISAYVMQCFTFVLKSNAAPSTEEITMISDLAITMLSVSDCQEVDDYLQMQLLLLALCPFIQYSELLYNHFQQAFEAETNRITHILNAARGHDSTVGWRSDTLVQLANLNLDYLSTKNKYIFVDFIVQIFASITDSQHRSQIMKTWIGFIIQDCYRLHKFHDYLLAAMNDTESHLAVSENLRNFLCLATSSECHVFQTAKNSRFQYQLTCRHCDPRDSNTTIMDGNAFLQLADKANGKYIQTSKNAHVFNEASSLKFFQLFSSEDARVRCNMTKCVPALLNHLDTYCFDAKYMDLWLSPVLDDNLEARLSMVNYVPYFQSAVRRSKLATPELIEAVTERGAAQLLKSTRKFLPNGSEADQSCVLTHLLAFATSNEATDTTLHYCFRVILYFCICSTSQVSRKATMRATEMCHRFGITPKTLLVWHKTNLFKLIVPLCVSNYLNHGISLEKSLHGVSHMFGYIDDCKLDFIAENCGTMIAMLVPFVIKYEKCLRLVEEICDIVQKDLASTIAVSFLSIYTNLYVNEATDVSEQCLQFLVQKTARSLNVLLKSDIKRTLAEILVYYHMNPELVMRTFTNLTSDDPRNGQPMTSSATKLADYIADRFLCVICHFEQILIFDNEKFLKREVLLSLGEIMRLMGSARITQFRFKLLAVLRTALTIDQDGFKKICADIWKIFISTVDLISLGPLLSTIFVSLEPLMETHPHEVNEILKYLIINNGNLLSVHISDLFFLKDTAVSDEIKAYVQRYTEKSNETFMDKFHALFRHINHDNVTVRIYGLNYLTELFEKNRLHLNELIVGQQQMHTIIENLLETLMTGIKSHDEALKIATGRCLGRLGAIEPSHLTPNYGPQQSFALSIATDEFAIMSLAELCMAYQFQKDTKNVDGYSLAIQEILMTREVCPKQKKNMKVWEAIPDRMRPLMEPLLTSCYTMTQGRFSRMEIHPIFGSVKCRTYNEWAMTWALKTIEVIEDDAIKSLLRSFKPCMRCDNRMLTLFLPYIVMHAIQQCESNARREIAEEILVVAKSIINPMERNADAAQDIKRFGTIPTIEFVPSRKESSSDPATEESNDIGIKCAKLAFNQLDFIDRWVRSTKPNEPNYAVMKEFIDQFDKKLIARANFACSEYARALMYLESYIEDKRDERLQTELSFLFKIHAELADPDPLEGALNVKVAEPTLSEQIVKNNVQGRLQESAVYFERLLHTNTISENDCIEMIHCYMGLDQPETAILLANGLMKEFYDQHNDALLQSSAEPLWRLGRFDELNELIDTRNLKDSTDWGIRCGQILLNFRLDDDVAFDTEVDKSRLVILENLRIVGDEQNSYQKGYSNVMKLHLISEIEQARDSMNQVIDASGKVKNANAMQKLFLDWTARTQLLQPVPRIVEPVLCLRRIVCNEAKKILGKRMEHIRDAYATVERQIDNFVGESFIKSTELAREAGMHQQAELYILNAETYRPKNLFIEKAKLFWRKGDQSNSFKVLERGIEGLNTKNDAATHGEAKFLIANQNAEAMNINIELNVKLFKEVLGLLPTSEKCFVHYAQYLDKTLAAMPTTETDGTYNPKVYDLQVEIMYLYCKSMMFGTNYIYQAMPRVLSIWLDFTATNIVQQTADDRRRADHFQRTATKMHKVISSFSDQLPAFTFFTAFSQLISRICHPSNEVHNLLRTIIIKLILAFPQQSLWMMLSVYKSSYANRVRRCTEIFSDKRLSSKPMQKMIQDFNSLAETMIELTNKDLPAKVAKFSIKSIHPQLPSILTRPDFSQILLPFEKYMQPVLPSLHQRDTPGNVFNAFPNRAVFITGIRDELSVLPSLQRPRRVTLRGSDGNDYVIMMKPKDDLRRDFRLMEFNSVVKKYLHHNANARQRRLNIRTYAVVPLNEECGLIEWVSNLQTFRMIVQALHKQRNLVVSSKALKEGQSLSRDRKRDWLNGVLAKQPPVFAEWFRERFTTPHNWYQARTSYVRTTAVMSIVGYILGLGDRHGENILFDAGNGDTVHVDFNCLFNKGELFEVPEIVPFRLTHNMVHAMGPLRIEGAYRKCCEVTLKVLQEQMPTLMSVLRPLVYDPLVTWNRQSKTDGRTERTDAQAMVNVANIEQRLKGYVKINKKNSSMPLSTEGVVNHCILEATNIDNLAAMYIGWAPYL